MALHPKVTSGVVAGAVTSILLGELARRGVTLGPDEAAGITALLSFAASYFMPVGDDGIAPAPAAAASPAPSAPAAPSPPPRPPIPAPPPSAPSPPTGLPA